MLKTKKLFILTTEEQLKRIDDYRFENRLESRGEAVRQLIDIAFDCIEKSTKK